MGQIRKSAMACNPEPSICFRVAKELRRKCENMRRTEVELSVSRVGQAQPKLKRRCASPIALGA
jgi:hypothetical protein